MSEENEWSKNKALNKYISFKNESQQSNDRNGDKCIIHSMVDSVCCCLVSLMEKIECRSSSKENEWDVALYGKIDEDLENNAMDKFE